MEQETECQFTFENIGWTLGNECPYRCSHCYSMAAREKGKDLSVDAIDRIIDQLSLNRVKTVNLGGNEPLFTNGLNPKKTMLPYIIRSLYERGIVVGLTTAGITVNYLSEVHPEEFKLLNDVDISLDSPFAQEHNLNRKAVLFDQAMNALKMCCQAGIDHTIVMCGMTWNLSDTHIDALVELARSTGSNIRINFIKPTETAHLHTVPTREVFYKTSMRLLSQCEPLDLGEPLLSAVLVGKGKGCPCGTKSFRIHSITPDGKVPVSPCVYLHDYRVGDLLVDDLIEIVNSNQFGEFRDRHVNPGKIKECEGCELLDACRGGCAARAYLHSPRGTKGLLAQDPYCFRGVDREVVQIPTNQNLRVNEERVLVHRDYLCTLIVRPV